MDTFRSKNDMMSKFSCKIVLKGKEGEEEEGRGIEEVWLTSGNYWTWDGRECIHLFGPS